MENEIVTTKRVAIHSVELEEWLKEYDAIMESYPEHYYEGFSVWQFLKLKMEGKKGGYISFNENIDGFEEWIDEIHALRKLLAPLPTK
jgi:hypothetical protein